jgi:hypothetical protein
VPIFTKLNSKHSEELEQSAIAPDLAALNFVSMDRDTIFEYLCYSEKIKRTNTGRLPSWVVKLFANSEEGGWWCSGLDPLNNWEPMLWGCFKPDVPRQGKTGFDPNPKPKPIKYEHPLKTQPRAFFLRVPDRLWDAVACRYGLTIPDSERARGFWPWIWDHPEIPLFLTEGAKKAACLLSHGYAAIALPGIAMGYRATRDESRRVLHRDLIPELAHFATLGRQFRFCFDHESKQKTFKSVRINLGITATLLGKAGCSVTVIELPGPHKGVDDHIVAMGAADFEIYSEKALPIDEWKAHEPYLLTYPPSVIVNTRYLGKIDLPETGIALVRSPKGTGKTTALESRIGEAIRDGRRVLVISHRIQLCRGICTKLGINYVDEIWGESETGQLLGYGLCIDSLHPDSQARFKPQDWRGAIIILDECEQIIWHLLNSTTCYHTRVNIIRTFKELLHVVLTTGGLVIAQDADLSDLSVDYLISLAHLPLQPTPWLLVNQYKPKQGWEVSYYQTSDPSPVVGKLMSVLNAGQRAFVALDSQQAKSRWGSKNLESYLCKKFPDKRILRIDSETVADPQSPAYGIIDHLNEDIINYDVVLATPSIGTGVSIDIRGHFHAVFGIYQGAIPDPEIRQALARVREDVPRFVWARSFSACKIGNGSLNYRDLQRSVQQYVKQTISMLKDADFDIDRASDPISLRTWAKMGARVNTSMQSYRVALRQGLIDEGHQVTDITIDPSPETSTALKNSITDVRDANRQQEAQAIADAEEISPIEASRLRDKRKKTQEERRMEEKHDLQNRYGGIPITADLKLKDAEGWYRKLQLHFYLVQAPEIVRDRDFKHLTAHLERGNGAMSWQDLRFFTSAVEALKIFEIEKFLDPDRLLRKSDQDLIAFANKAMTYRGDIKTFLGFTVPNNANPIQILGMFLNTLGLELECIKREVLPDGGRMRVYRFVAPKDGRHQVFAAWEHLARPHPDIYDQPNVFDGQAAA